jgi:hypothetical protein
MDRINPRCDSFVMTNVYYRHLLGSEVTPFIFREAGVNASSPRVGMTIEGEALHYNASYWNCTPAPGHCWITRTEARHWEEDETRARLVRHWFGIVRMASIDALYWLIIHGYVHNRLSRFTANVFLVRSYQNRNVPRIYFSEFFIMFEPIHFVNCVMDVASNPLNTSSTMAAYLRDGRAHLASNFFHSHFYCHSVLVSNRAYQHVHW